MKKIMKKVLSLALVVALAIAPMTVMAADDPELYTNGSTEILNLLEGTVWRDFDPTEDGTLTITLESVNGPAALTVTNYSDYSQPIRAQVTTGQTYSLDYVAGVNYEFTFEMAAASADVCAVAYSVTLRSGETGSDESGSGTTAGSTEFDPIVLELVNGSTSVQVNQNSKVFYAVSVQAGTEYTLIVSPGMMGGLNLHVGLDAPLYGYNQSVETTFIPRGYSYVFAIEGLGMNPNFTIELKEAEPENTTGTMDNKDALVLDQYKEISFSGQPYYCTWTATEAGTLSIEMPSMFNSSGWTYAINDEEYDIMGYGSSADDSQNPAEYAVQAGDVITVWFATESLEEGGFADGFSVFYKATFTAGSTGNQGGSGDEGGSGDSGDQGGQDDDANFVEDSTPLVVGDNALAVSNMYQYTVYYFQPTETGKYTFTTSDSVMGIVGYHWVNGNPTADVVKETSFEWDCTDVNQGIYVAVMADTNVANINIAKGELDESEEIPWTVYTNKKAPTAFVFSGDANKLEYVNTEDAVVDKAVLGKDGYYHLNKEDGEILYVNLNDSIMSLIGMAGYGKVSAVEYDGNNNVLAKYDYTDAVLAYAACVDANTSLYPLTEDLITIYQEVGKANTWYGENGWIGGTAEDAWMFACYYVKGQTTSTTPAPGTNSGATSGATQVPATGDNANVAVWAIVMVVAAGAAYVVAENKKRAR